jgi:hypothetical protein
MHVVPVCWALQYQKLDGSAFNEGVFDTDRVILCPARERELKRRLLAVMEALPSQKSCGIVLIAHSVVNEGDDDVAIACGSHTVCGAV